VDDDLRTAWTMRVFEPLSDDYLGHHAAQNCQVVSFRLFRFWP